MRDGLLPGRPWGGLEAPEHVGKTISYSQMLSGHYSSYAWTPRGRPKHTAEEGISMNRGQEEGPTGDFLRRVKWVLVRPTMSEKAPVANGGACVELRECVPLSRGGNRQQRRKWQDVRMMMGRMGLRTAGGRLIQPAGLDAVDRVHEKYKLCYPLCSHTLLRCRAEGVRARLGDLHHSKGQSMGEGPFVRNCQRRQGAASLKPPVSKVLIWGATWT